MNKTDADYVFIHPSAFILKLALVLKWIIMRRFERCVPGSSPGGGSEAGNVKGPRGETDDHTSLRSSKSRFESWRGQSAVGRGQYAVGRQEPMSLFCLPPANSEETRIRLGRTRLLNARARAALRVRIPPLPLRARDGEFGVVAAPDTVNVVARVRFPRSPLMNESRPRWCKGAHSSLSRCQNGFESRTRR